MRKIIELNSVLGNYSVTFVEQLSDIERLIDADNTFTFIDKNVQRLYPSLHRDTNVAIECIESNKTFGMAEVVLTQMADLGVKSNSTILVIGGGILQDLVGFCCSVYHRGVNYILIPTTLLAQADSCIGGKTSINFHKKKNILGTFFPPKQILIYTGFLDTLEDAEYISGMGEVYKFHILQNKMKQFTSALDKANIENTIYDSLLFKKNVLDVDEFDKKERKFLNFGHTFGHALEYTSNNKIPHGVGVIIGSMVSCIVSEQMNYRVPDSDLIYLNGAKLIHGIELKEEWFVLANMLDAVKMDKKNTGKIIDVLINDHPILVPLEDTAVIEYALKSTLQRLY